MAGIMITDMLKKIGSSLRPPHLYMAEWRDHFGYSVQKVADRVETSRETIWRWENEQHRLNPEKIGLYATALGIQPEQLFFPPGRESADSHLKKLPQAKFEEAIDIVKRLAR
jgi:transcriptional regulator with XRE-family HTH domain